jgi:hypothetical protein
MPPTCLSLSVKNFGRNYWFSSFASLGLWGGVWRYPPCCSGIKFKQLKQGIMKINLKSIGKKIWCGALSEIMALTCHP